MSRTVGTICLTAAVMSLGAPVALARSLPSSPLDGRWTFTWTQAELDRGGAPRVVPTGRFVVEFRAGHITRLKPRPVLRGGRFTTRRNVAMLVFPPPAPAGIVANRVYTMRWSIYRDRLTWSRVPGRAALDIFFVTPWTRVR